MYKITFLSTLLVVGFLGCQASVVEAATTSSASSNRDTSLSMHDRAAVESRVREYFSDIPVMIEIARCESNFRQFTDSGNVLKTNAGMVGVFQLYEEVHETAAAALGFDIDTLEGNIGYAEHLYQSSGTTPWKSCVSTSEKPNEQMELRIELLKKIISLLQQLLALQLAGK